MPDKRDKRIIDTLKAGIARVETGGEKNPYLAKNRKGSSATGKYQFLKEWFSRPGKVKGIKEFADSKGGVFGEINSMEDFRQSPELQEAYFSYYAENVLLPNAKKALVKNPMGLSLDQAAMFYHFKSPQVAKKTIQTGKMNGSTDMNISENAYLTKYNEGIKEAGLSNIKYNDYLIDKKKVDGVNLTPEEKTALKSVDQRKADYIKRDQAITEMDDVENGIKERLRRNLLKEIARNGDQAVWDEAIEEQNQAIREAKEAPKKLQEDYKKKGFYDKKNYNEDWAKSIKNTIQKNKEAKEKGVDSIDDVQERIKPQWEPIEQEVEAEMKKQKPTPEMEKVKERPVPKVGTVTEEKEILSNSDNKGLAKQYFSTAQEINAAKQGNNMSVPEQKRELPIEAATGLALGLIGNEQAKNADISLRTEEVNEAINQYTADLARRAKKGLPVEIEAAMNNKQAEAYQSGLENIKNASAGNRALVLGNQGQLETARNKGLVDIQVADYEAKERAFQQYGQMLKYKNDFDARRDIANHGIKYQEGKEQQQRGRQLAEAGFAKLADEIQYQRENGPGSTNAMYKSYLMQKMFGFDPNAKDDGSGNVEGTRSWFMKNKAKVEEEAGLLNDYRGRLESLNPEKQRAVDNFIETNSNQKDVLNFVDYLSNNDVNPNKINMDNMDIATKKNNYGLLSMNRKDAEAWTSQPEKPSSEGLLSMQPKQENITEQPILATTPINQDELDSSEGLLKSMSNLEQSIGLIH